LRHSRRPPRGSEAPSECAPGDAFERGCVDAKLDPMIAQSASRVCALFLETVDGGKLGTVDPAVIQAAEARMCELGHCRHGK
jgi:hypothetical protein